MSYRRLSIQILKSICIATFGLLVSLTVTADLSVAVEPTDSTATTNAPETADVEQLLNEAQQLFILRQPIDARSKLLKALQVAPTDYRPHMLLGTYYLSEVGHFQLAYRYLLAAEKYFEERYGNEDDQIALGSKRAREPFPFQHHSRLLYLLAEARLNLDDYAGSLATLDRFEKLYWDQWYPGTRAWVLMKLKRVPEAISVAQRGILLGAEPTRTYNILGILLSLSDQRELSLQAFQRAIRAEYLDGGTPHPATPLNNAGEVYSEMFEDRTAEAAWTRALQMPDGCDHVLPSLNLAIMMINELRLLQADRILRDFEACYAQQPMRTDTEHRSLLALARGRIALRSGDAPSGVKLIETAADRQQWFGKIGTDPDDLKFAATVTLAKAMRAKASVIKDRAATNPLERAQNFLQIRWSKIRAWWLERQARSLGVKRLNDLEDLSIRNTDAMLEYPTLGAALTGFSTSELESRIERLIAEDDRPLAHSFYRVYLATNYIERGHEERGLKLLAEVEPTLRPFDRLLRAELLARSIMARLKMGGWFGPSTTELEKIFTEAEKLYEVLPSHIRNYDLYLPVAAVRVDGTASAETKRLTKLLLSHRFQIAEGARRYELVIEPGDSSKPWDVTLWDRTLNSPVSYFRAKIEKPSSRPSSAATSIENIEQFYNRAIDELFHHRVDPPAEPLPELAIMAGLRG